MVYPLRCHNIGNSESMQTSAAVWKSWNSYIFARHIYINIQYYSICTLNIFYLFFTCRPSDFSRTERENDEIPHRLSRHSHVLYLSAGRSGGLASSRVTRQAEWPNWRVAEWPDRLNGRTDVRMNVWFVGLACKQIDQLDGRFGEWIDVWSSTRAMWTDIHSPNRSPNRTLPDRISP